MSGYVVYDVSYLNNFFTVIKNAIGSATNIGIVVFGVILSVTLITVIVKKFTRR